MIDTVIFDMDGVIIDSEPMHMAAEQELFQRLGLSVSNERHRNFVGTSTENMWEALKQEFQVSHSIAELVTLNKTIYRRKVAESPQTPIAGVPDLIVGLKSKGIKLAVASSSVPEDIDMVLDMFQLKKYFDVLMSGSYVRHSKPHPEIFVRTAEKMMSAPQRCLVIEDSTNGVRAAKSAGMKCLGYQNPNSGDQDLTLADRIVHSLTQISIDELVRF